MTDWALAVLQVLRTRSAVLVELAGKLSQMKLNKLFVAAKLNFALTENHEDDQNCCETCD